MPSIIPIKDLKNTARISTMVHESTEPVYVTKNGYGDMVLMSMESYENMIHKYHMYRQIANAEQDISEGKTRPAKEALADLRGKYGL